MSNGADMEILKIFRVQIGRVINILDAKHTAQLINNGDSVHFMRAIELKPRDR